MPVETRAKRKREVAKEADSEEKPEIEEEEEEEEPKQKKKPRTTKKGAKQQSAKKKQTKKTKKQEEEEEGKEAEEEKAETKKASTSVSVHVGDSDKRYQSTVLEKGQIYFFYRPKISVKEGEVHSLEDIQRMYLILKPTETSAKGDIGELESMHALHGKKASEEKTKTGEEEEVITDQNRLYNRLILIGKKELPEIKTHSKHFALVYKVSHEIGDLKKHLEGYSYKTLKGETHTLEPARPVGEGVYAIVKHEKHTHLAYALELPKEIGEAQQLFNIEREGSFIIQVKNENLVEGSHVHYTEEEKKLFHGTKFQPAYPLQVLNHDGAGLLIIGASKYVGDDLGVPGVELENEAEYSKLTDKNLFEELKLKQSTTPSLPLTSGTLA